MKSYYILHLIITISLYHTIAQPVKYSNEFLQIGVGARALSLGGASIGSVRDITSVYWNPAALTSIGSPIQIGAMHSEYFAGIAKFDFIGLGFRANDATSLGFSFIRLGVDDIPNTLDLIDENGNVNYDRITSFSANDFAFFTSFARKTKIDGLSIGTNAKIIHRKIGPFAKAWGFGIDAGAKYTKNNWITGVMIRDITTTFNAWKFNTETFEDVFIITGNDIPENSIETTMPRILASGARNFELLKHFHLQPEIALEITTDGKRNTLISTKLASIDPRIGLEIDFKKIIYLRAGANNYQKIPDFDNKVRKTIQPNIGLGLQIKHLSIDYAFTNVSFNSDNNTLYSHIFSLSYSIQKKEKVEQIK
ncbi:MAG: PorV/PorQ family protein [Bacteroidales bacterium]